jgi:pimeloyl-ACP methyl ester carboxylesterase
MARVQRPDGVELLWEERGEGPLVVLAPYWSMHPSVHEPMLEDLETDHRVVRYDDRGAGKSTRAGPYDLDTAAADLAAVIETAGGSAVVVASADGPHRAVRAAVDRPELIEAVVSVGGPPVGIDALANYDTLASSRTVVNAMIEMAETDYRSALRSILTSTNPQMSEEQVRERVRLQADYAPAEAAVPRLQAWVEADSTEHARAIGGRLWILHWEGMGGGWAPTGRELELLVAEKLPESHLERTDDGMVSRPDQAAGVVRKITAPVRTTGS